MSAPSKEVYRRYDQSEKGKARKLRYRQSEKGKAKEQTAHERAVTSGKHADRQMWHRDRLADERDQRLLEDLYARDGA